MELNDEMIQVSRIFIEFALRLDLYNCQRSPIALGSPDSYISLRIKLIHLLTPLVLTLKTWSRAWIDFQRTGVNHSNVKGKEVGKKSNDFNKNF